MAFFEVPSVPAFRKMRVAPGTRTFTDISRNSDSRRRDPRRKSGSHLTPCWRKADSNSWSHLQGTLSRALYRPDVDVILRRWQDFTEMSSRVRENGGPGRGREPEWCRQSPAGNRRIVRNTVAVNYLGLCAITMPVGG
jgi:hypothetical protein